MRNNVSINNGESLEDVELTEYEEEHNQVVSRTHPDTCYTGSQVHRRYTLDELDNNNGGRYDNQ